MKRGSVGQKTAAKVKKFFRRLGPGFITGASDDDPSGIATYSQTGAIFGYGQLWTALFSFPFMTAIQEMCGRIGLVTGKGLAGVIKRYYSRRLLYFCVGLLLVANIINIGADLGAMASVSRMVLGIPFIYSLIIITLFTLILQLLVPYRLYAKYLKYLTFSLLSYFIVVFLVEQNWTEILRSTFIPSVVFSREYLFNIVAILGTTISPYLFFWQASEEVEEEVDKRELRSMGAGVPKFKRQDISDMRFDTIIGMFFSNVVMFFIIISTASTLHVGGIFEIQTADQAANALRPLAGDLAYLFFAFGIIATGLLAIPILAGSASYAISETFGFKEGLYRKFKSAHAFYGVIALATVVGVFINFAPVTPFEMLYYTAIINGICAPPLLIVIMLVSNNKKIMGKYTNGKWLNILGWSIAGIMAIAALVLIANVWIL